MIKFFRKIREQLIMENKNSKYFKYALGEIILVVIGILIALQISNWNENRKQHLYENKMLGEIRTALVNDKAHMEDMLKRLKEPESAAIMFIDMIYKKQSFTDSHIVPDVLSQPVSSYFSTLA